MNLVMQLVAAVNEAMNERHYASAGAIAYAAYIMSMRNKLPIDMQRKLGSISKCIDYGNYKNAKDIANNLLDSVVLI